jgi:hypothetical protein
MSGQGRGFCVLKISDAKPSQLLGFAGLQSVPIDHIDKNFEKNPKEVINMPFGDGTGPAGMGPMTGRAADVCAGYPVPGYMNPVMGRAGSYNAGMLAIGPYGGGTYIYGMPYAGWSNPWLRRGFGFGRGFGRGHGRGRGRGRFGY